MTQKDGLVHTPASPECVEITHLHDGPWLGNRVIGRDGDVTSVDQAFAQTFKAQEQIGKVLTVLAGLAMLIACLGLLGMIIYSL